MKLKFTKVKFVTVSKQLDPNAIQATQNPVKLKFTKVKFVTVSKQLDPNAIQTTQNSVKLKFTKVKLVTAKPSPKDLIFKKNEISFKYIYNYIYIYIYITPSKRKNSLQEPCLIETVNNANYIMHNALCIRHQKTTMQTTLCIMYFALWKLNLL